MVERVITKAVIGTEETDRDFVDVCWVQVQVVEHIYIYFFFTAGLTVYSEFCKVH